MKEMIIETKVKVCHYDELSDADKKVVDAARAATANSYAIYSKFHVGAAVLLANGIVVSGSNQENAAYPSGLCAERTTLFWANSQYPNEAVKVCLGDNINVKTLVFFDRMRIALDNLISCAAQKPSGNIFTPVSMGKRDIVGLTPLHVSSPSVFPSAPVQQEHQSK